jgi:hypothetical protein
MASNPLHTAFLKLELASKTSGLTLQQGKIWKTLLLILKKMKFALVPAILAIR